MQPHGGLDPIQPLGGRGELTSRRTRKISKSSEDVRVSSPNPLDTVLMPFAKLTQGLHTLGTNLDTTLSR